MCLLTPSGDQTSPHLRPHKSTFPGPHVTLESHPVLPGLIQKMRREGWMLSEVLSGSTTVEVACDGFNGSAVRGGLRREQLYAVMLLTPREASGQV